MGYNAAMQDCEGLIVQVVPSGLAYVEELGSKKVYPFRFGRIQGYRGETARELKLKIGARVWFSVVDGRVSQVAKPGMVLARSPQQKGNAAAG